MRKLAKHASIMVIVCSAVVMVFQNCGQTPKSLMGSSPLTSDETPAKFDQNCLQLDDYDACLFFKNPSNTLATIQNEYTLADLDQQQVYGVSLSRLTNPQELKDDQLQVSMMDGTLVQSASFRIPASSTTVRLPASGSSNGFDNLLAVQAYYWSREVLNFFESVQADILAGFRVNIVPQAPVMGWSPNIKTIFLSNDETNLRKNSALDASTVTHLSTEAVIHYLSLGKIYDMTGDADHKDCGPNSGPFLKNDCCKTKNGCSKAISAGISDYVSALLFPTSPMLGDYLSGDIDGSKSCSLSRNPTKNKLTTFQQAYDSCAATGRAGQFYDLGTVLSATLQAVSSQLGSSERKAFHVVLVKAIQKLKGADNFTSFRDLLLQEATASAAPSSVVTAIEAEFLKRF